MIKYNPKDWYGLIFEFHKSDTLRTLFKTLLIFSIYSLVVIYLELHFTNFKSTITVHSLLGFVLGLLLVFRTNTAYERWWEGRKQWGILVNNSRNLSSKITSILDEKEDENELNIFKNLLINFPFACKNHLRNEKSKRDIDFYQGDQNELIEKIDHVPYYIIKTLQKRINDLYVSKKIKGDH